MYKMCMSKLREHNYQCLSVWVRKMQKGLV
jgi:hypothetical protein